MPISIKLKAFEYIVLKLIDWFNISNPNGDYSSDFSKLKLTKLLFFVSAVDASESNKGLLVVFDNFWAMPFGHVESDVYNELHMSELFEISKNGIQKKKIPSSDYFQEITYIIPLIELSIQRLSEENSDIINYTAFDLVELSHSWQSWQSIFNLAKNEGKQSLKIPNLMIQVEPKIYFLEIES